MFDRKIFVRMCVLFSTHSPQQRLSLKGQQVFHLCGPARVGIRMVHTFFAEEGKVGHGGLDWGRNILSM